VRDAETVEGGAVNFIPGNATFCRILCASGQNLNL